MSNNISEKRNWSAADDEVLLKAILTLIPKENYTLNMVLEYVAKELDRSPKACHLRFLRKVKERVPPEILELIRNNNPFIKEKSTKLTENRGFQNKPIGESLNSEVIRDSTSHILNSHEVKYQVHEDEDFSNINNLVSELKHIEKRRAEIKEKLERYKEYLSNILKN